MKTVATLWLKGMLREPEAIDKNPWRIAHSKEIEFTALFRHPCHGRS